MDKRKKIALLSVYKDPNYGSMLQAYALYAVIKNIGYSSEYINYQHYNERAFIIQVAVNCFRKISNWVLPSGSFWNTEYFKKQHRIFDEFQKKYIPESSIKYTPSNIHLANNYYSIFIVGSDQMWSPFVTALPNSINFLDFVEGRNIKTSYAPSVGTTHISNDYLHVLKCKLQSFQNVSCREYENSNILSKVLKKEVTYVLDPTLLLCKENWAQIFEPIDMPQDYILCYILGEKNCISKYAENLGAKKNMPVYYIVTQPLYITRGNALHHTTVGQFLYLINNAKYVVTDSFHGSIFSINFEVNFYSFAKRPFSSKMNDNDRILDFFNRIGLSERFKNDDDKTYNEDIDFNSVRECLNRLRKSSFGYLQSIVNLK